jgi:16S rRNA (guanine527-N7)-methyltransferase
VDRPRDPLPTRVESCPPLPAEYHDSLEAALAALDVVLDQAARRAIDGHVRILLAWNAAINLTSVRDPAEIAIRHVADSLTALRVLEEAGIEAFLDLGSGGGYPGLPLAAAMPGAEALLVDSVGKKARFLGVAIEAVGLGDRVRVGSVRAEGLAADDRHRERWPGVTARAVAPLADLIELAFPLLVPGGLLIAWKKAEIEAELAAGRRALDGLGGGSIEVRSASSRDLAGLEDHRLVLVRRGRLRIPAAYPRDPASRRRRPW